MPIDDVHMGLLEVVSLGESDYVTDYRLRTEYLRLLESHLSGNVVIEGARKRSIAYLCSPSLDEYLREIISSDGRNLKDDVPIPSFIV